MGVNTSIYLPHDVRVKDVADAIGLLSGLHFVRKIERGHTRLFIPGVSVEITCVAEMVWIQLRGNLIDGETDHRANYHFENADYPGYSRLLTAPSTAYWLSVGKHLIEFFGGRLVFQEHSREKGMIVQNHRPLYNPEDDGQYDNFQRQLFDIKALTAFDLEQLRQYAAYQEE